MSTPVRRGSRSAISIFAMLSSPPPASPHTHGRPDSSRNSTPIAWAAPQPPSVVAEPPTPTTIRLAPSSRAARMSCPVPNVVVRNGSRSSGGTRASPDAAAISTTAVRFAPGPSMPKRARIGRPSGSNTSAAMIRPPVAATIASTVPSPPSAIGQTSMFASGHVRSTPTAIAWATSSAGSVSLNESGATTIFISRPLSSARRADPSRRGSAPTPGRCPAPRRFELPVRPGHLPGSAPARRGLSRRTDRPGKSRP